MAVPTPPIEHLISEPTAGIARLITVLTVVATLTAGVVGYTQAVASRAGDRAATDGQRLGIAATAARERTQQRAYAVYDRYVVWQESLARLANVLQRNLPGPAAEPRTDRVDAARLRKVSDSARRAASRLARESRLPDITRQAWYGTEDPFFPFRFITAAERRGVVLSGLSEAADVEASEWGADQAKYLAVLTMLAVALYLFGFSLTRHAELRGLFVGVGILLLLTGAGWAGVTAASSPSRAPREAAEQFAAGHALLRSGTTVADFRRAERHFSRAIELSPGLSRPYAERSSVTFSAGSPQITEPRSITEPRALERAAADMQRARDLGNYTPGLLSSLGFYWLVAAVRDGAPELLDRSVAAAREAVTLAEERGEDDPIPKYNLGVALLAAGRVDEARKTYDDALRETPNWPNDGGIVAGALTDLDLVAQRSDDRLAREAELLKDLIVGRKVLDGEEESGAPISVRVRPTPGGLLLRSDDQELCTRDLAAIWYHTAQPDLGWAVRQGSVSTWFRSCEPGLGSFGYESELVNSYPASCLPDGEYRLELYDHHRIVARRRVRADFGDARALDARDLGILMCHPRGWNVWPGAERGLSAAVVSPRADRGIFAARLTHRAPPRQAARVLNAVLRRYQAVIDVAPRTPSESRRAFMELPGATSWRYEAAGRTALAGIGMDDDGSTVVGVVFGPRTWFATQEPLWLYDSLTLRYTP